MNVCMNVWVRVPCSLSLWIHHHHHNKHNQKNILQTIVDGLQCVFILTWPPRVIFIRLYRRTELAWLLAHCGCCWLLGCWAVGCCLWAPAEPYTVHTPYTAFVVLVRIAVSLIPRPVSVYFDEPYKRPGTHHSKAICGYGFRLPRCLPSSSNGITVK